MCARTRDTLFQNAPHPALTQRCCHCTASASPSLPWACRPPGSCGTASPSIWRPPKLSKRFSRGVRRQEPTLVTTASWKMLRAVLSIQRTTLGLQFELCGVLSSAGATWLSHACSVFHAFLCTFLSALISVWPFQMEMESYVTNPIQIPTSFIFILLLNSEEVGLAWFFSTSLGEPWFAMTSFCSQWLGRWQTTMALVYCLFH